MNKNRMLGLVFPNSISNYLAKLEDSLEDQHFVLICGCKRVQKLFPFYPADLALLRRITVSQCFDTPLSEGIDKSVSTT
jgi:hypothetical protein